MFGQSVNLIENAVSQISKLNKIISNLIKIKQVPHEKYFRSIQSTMYFIYLLT